MGKLTAAAAAVKAQAGSPWKLPGAREREHEEKRMAVLLAAAELFVTRGYHGTTLNHVAERLNVTKPAIYYYFASKDEILLACIRMGVEKSESFFAEHDDPNLTGRERLQAYMTFYAKNIVTPFGMCLVRIADQDVEPATQKQLVSAKRAAYRRIRDLVDAGVADGSIAPCDTRATAFTIAGALGWLCHWFRPGGALSAEQAIAEVTGLLTRGLTPRANPEGAGRRT